MRAADAKREMAEARAKEDPAVRRRLPPPSADRAISLLGSRALRR